MLLLSMTAKDFKKQHIKKGYTQARLAREFDIDVITITRWERNVIAIPGLAELALLSLKQRRKGKGTSMALFTRLARSSARTGLI